MIIKCILLCSSDTKWKITLYPVGSKLSSKLSKDSRMIGVTIGSDMESVKTEDFEKQFYDKFVITVKSNVCYYLCYIIYFI